MSLESNFAEDIEHVALPEQIEEIVISKFEGDARHNPGNLFAGRILSWDEAKPALDYIYESGYGPQDCHDIYAYTPTRFIFTCRFGGITSIAHIQRNPI